MLHHNFYEYHRAVKRSDWRYIEEYIKNGGNINAQLKKTGSQAGYTALHFAVLKNDPTCARKLIADYGANVNLVGEDGAQPLHLAYLTQSLKVAKVLLSSGANPDTELPKRLHGKYAKDKKWSDDFGDKMPLLVFTIINADCKLGKLLLENKPNVWIKDTNNKTLLMYAVNSRFFTSLLLAIYKDSPEFIDARDNNGLHVFHHLLHDSQFEGFRYDLPISHDTSRSCIGLYLLNAGADINAMVNGNPDTLLLNMAAFRCCNFLLDCLIDFNVSPRFIAKPLRYFLIPVDEDKYVLPCDDYDHTAALTVVNERKGYCATKILENYVLRQEFGLFVPEDEILLMNQLVAVDDGAKEIVKDVDNFINRSFKNLVLSYGDKSMTFYEIMKKVFNNRALKLLVKDHEFYEEYTKTFCCSKDLKDDRIKELVGVVAEKIVTARIRRQLMEKIEKIPGLMEAIPLPYEIVLDIIEFINNKNLKNFVDAFY